MMFRYCTAALVSLLVFASPSKADELGHRMGQAVDAYASSHRFMGSVLVVRHGEVLLDKAYGYANLEWQVPDTTATRYRLGSITKQFTAAAVLLLQERGLLSLDDPVSTYLADWPKAWGAVTIRHLLNHTSGIPNITELPDFDTWKAFPTTPAQSIGRLRDRPLEFPVGSRWKYSNTNYIVLGEVIERVAKQPYADFIKANLLVPLGMHDTGYDLAKPILERRAAGYVEEGKLLRNADIIDMSLPFAAGGLYSTTHDLRQWEEGLLGGRVLKPASLKAMLTPFKGDYGLGLVLKPLAGHRLISHPGDIDGFSARIADFPDDGIFIVVLSNIANDGADDVMVALEKLSVDKRP